MSALEIILVILLIAAIGAGGWLYVAKRFKVRDTAHKVADAVKGARQA